MRGSLALTIAAGVEEIEDDMVLRGIAEIVSDDRPERVVDEILHRAEARDDLGCVEGADVDDLGNVQIELRVAVRPGRYARARSGIVGPP